MCFIRLIIGGNPFAPSSAPAEAGGLSAMLSPRAAPNPSNPDTPTAHRNSGKIGTGPKDRGLEQMEAMHSCSDGRGVRDHLFITSHRCVFVPSIMKTAAFALQFPLDSSVSIKNPRGHQIHVEYHKAAGPKAHHQQDNVQFYFSGFVSDVVCVHAFQKMSSISLGTNQIVAAAAAGVAVLSPFVSPLAFHWGSARDLIHTTTIEVLSAALAPSVSSSEKMPKFYISHCGEDRKVKPFPPIKGAAPIEVSLPTDMMAPLILQLKGSGMLGLIATFELGRAEIVNWLPHNSGTRHKRTESHKLFDEHKVEVCQVTLSICIPNLRELQSGMRARAHRRSIIR